MPDGSFILHPWSVAEFSLMLRHGYARFLFVKIVDLINTSIDDTILSIHSLQVRAPAVVLPNLTYSPETKVVVTVHIRRRNLAGDDTGDAS